MTAILSLFVHSSPTPKLLAHNRNELSPPPKARCLFAGWLYFSAILLALTALVACTPNLGSSTRGWSPAVAGEGMVYVATQQGQLKALTDGGFGDVRVRWTSAGSEEQIIGVYNTPAVGRELLYVSGIDGIVYALNKQSGSLSDGGWVRPLRQEDDETTSLVGSPALDENLGLVVVGSEDGNLYGLDSRNGSERWRFVAEDKIWSTPVIANGLVYFGSHDHNVYAVDANTGVEKWRTSTGGTVLAQPLVSRGQVLIGSFDRKLYALDANDGTVQWTFDGASNWYWAGAVASHSAIFVASMDGTVYGLDRVGNLLWEHDVGSAVVSTPALLPTGLVVASRNGKISLLRTDPGELGPAREISTLSVDPAEIRAPLFALPVVDEASLSQAGIQDGRDDQRESVYVGAQDGTVRRIQVKTAQILVWCYDTEEDEPCS